MEFIAQYCLTRGANGRTTIKGEWYPYRTYMLIRYADLSGSYETKGYLAPCVDEDRYVVL